MRLPVLMLVIALSAGCATQSAAPTAPATAAAKPVAQSTPAVANTKAPAEDRARIPAGYKAKTRDGQTVYCKKTARVGTRFETETCMTASEAAQLQSQVEQDREMLRRNQTICTGGCGGG